MTYNDAHLFFYPSNVNDQRSLLQTNIKRDDLKFKNRSVFFFFEKTVELNWLSAVMNIWNVWYKFSEFTFDTYFQRNNWSELTHLLEICKTKRRF